MSYTVKVALTVFVYSIILSTVSFHIGQFVLAYQIASDPTEICKNRKSHDE